MVDDEDDYWLSKKHKDPEWVAEVEAGIERARVMRETCSWLRKDNYGQED